MSDVKMINDYIKENPADLIYAQVDILNMILD